MTKAQVERQEEAMFVSYLHRLYQQHRPEQLSYFEHNLEVWKWVEEMGVVSAS